METREFLDGSGATQHKNNKASMPPRATDPGWAHGIMVNGGRQRIECKYCHKLILGGGISRLKQHLAAERGNVTPCAAVPEDVKLQMQEALGSKVKRTREKGVKSSNSVVPYFRVREDRGENADADTPIQKTGLLNGTGKRRGKNIEEGTSSKGRRRKKQCFPLAEPVFAQPLQQSLAGQEGMDQADTAVARFMYSAGLPLTVANSYYFQQMADAIAAVGPGYKMPSYHSLRSKLLNKSVQDVGAYCEELRKSWEVTGCSILVDRLLDKTGRTVMNFFVYCPKGTMFVKSLDASAITESPKELFDLFDNVVKEVGPENVVNFVTDTSSTYKAAGKLLMEKYKTFFWSACGTHCINLMLEEIGKMGAVKEVLVKAKRITQFIYNNSWVLNLLRKKTGGRDIVQLACTKSASIFQTLQEIVTSKDPLHQIFTGAAWMQSAFSKQKDGLEVAEILVDPLFWSICDQTLKVTNPLLTLLHLMDSDERPSMGYIYDAMEKARKSIMLAFDNNESSYTPYLNIIDSIWQEEFYNPLHGAAHCLNPSIFYKPSFSSSKKITYKGVLDCIETLEPNIDTQVSVTNHLNFYEKALGDFGRPVALHGRDSLPPATWWSLYAVDFPELQRLAVRILSQTCSIIRCKISYSVFENLHSMRKNRLENQRLNDLIFVHYNLHLQERRLESNRPKCLRGTLDPVCLEVMEADMGDWLEDPGAGEGKDLNWVDATSPGEKSIASHKANHIDDFSDNSDDRGSEDTKSFQENHDL